MSVFGKYIKSQHHHPNDLFAISAFFPLDLFLSYVENKILIDYMTDISVTHIFPSITSIFMKWKCNSVSIRLVGPE